MKVSKCPELHSKCNRAVANPSDFNPKDVPHVEVRVGSGESFIFSLISDPSIPTGELGFSMPQRKWAQLSINQDILVSPYRFDKNTSYISQLTVEIDYFTKKNNANDEYNSDEMAGEFLNQFGNLALTQGQQMVFGFSDKKLLVAVVKSIQCTDISNIKVLNCVIFISPYFKDNIEKLLDPFKNVHCPPLRFYAVPLNYF